MITGRIVSWKRHFKNNMLTLFVGIAFLLLAGCTDGSDRIFVSSYQDINWNRIGHYDAMFHTHPGLGDEQFDPHETVDRYLEEGYTILTLAGHDYDIPDDYIASIYPWTGLADIYEKIKHVQNPTEDNKTYEEMAKGKPYENRDPVALGMVSVEGCEVSAPHHIVSLFNSFTSGRKSEDQTFQDIQKLGGIAYFAHPGRYVERRGYTADWYIDYYNKYDLLIGQSFYNGIDRYPDDRPLYDRIVHRLGAERPIWLFGEDDMHTERTLGWNRNVILLENFQPGSMHPDIQDGSAPDVRRALENGYFYLWKPKEQYNRRAFNIVNMAISRNQIRLTIDNNDLVKEIRWMTHNPETDATETVHTGNRISINDVPEYSNFVRVEIEGEEGTIYTQPIYVK
jgi:hypothetical protein